MASEYRQWLAAQLEAGPARSPRLRAERVRQAVLDRRALGCLRGRPALAARLAGVPVFCSGCGGTGMVVNPNNDRLEVHHACAGEGVRR